MRGTIGQRETTGGVLGTALMAAGAAVLVLVVLWRGAYVASGEASVASLIFSVILSLVVAGPLLVVGWLLRRRAPGEAAAAAQLAERRTVLDADGTLRRGLVRELDQLLETVRDGAGRLTGTEAADVTRAERLLADVRDDLARPGYSSVAGLEVGAGLTRDQIASVRRYDDLVSAEVRRLGELGGRLGREPGAVATVVGAAELLASHVAEREALLGRGSVAPALRPQELLEAGRAPRRPIDDPVRLGLEDAVSYEGSDYVVRGVLDYFGGGRRWRVYQLHDGSQERWLEVRAGGAQLVWLERVPAPIDLGAGSVVRGGIEYRETDRGVATVTIESAAGRQEGVLVEYRHFGAGADALEVEGWPDGQRVLTGRSVAREDLDLWTKPAVAE